MLEYIPELGFLLDKPENLGRIGRNLVLSEILSADVKVPQVLKRNKKVFVYILEEKDQPNRRVYACRYRAGLGGPLLYFYIAFSPRGEVSFVHNVLPPTVAGKALAIDRFIDSVAGKQVPDWNPPGFSRGVAGKYEKKFVECIRGVDALNRAVSREIPW